MIFPEHLEAMPPQRKDVKSTVQNGEHVAASMKDQEMKVLQSHPVLSMLQNSVDQNGIIMSPVDSNAQNMVCDSLNSQEHFIRTRMAHLVGAFSVRAQMFLSKLQRPPTPTQSSTSSFNSSNAVSVQNLRAKKSRKVKESSAASSCTDCMSCARVLDPQSRAYLCWLVLVSLCFVYNCWAIPLRSSFPNHTLTVWESSLRKRPTEGPSPSLGTTNLVTEHQTEANSLDREEKSSLAASSPSSTDWDNYETLMTGYSSTYLKAASSILGFDPLANEGKNALGHEKTKEVDLEVETFPHSSSISPTEANSIEPKELLENSSGSTNSNALTPTWLILDVLADVMYLLDVLLVQPRVSVLTDNGIWAREISTTLHSYSKRKRSKLDVLSLLPLDIIFYFVGNGKDYAYLRIPRLLKVGTFREMCERLDVALSSPHVVRIARTVASMLYLVHLHACAYYLFSTWEGIASNGWVFSGRGNAYIRCFYFATKTATSIGKNPKPVNEAEYMFMTWSWLSGVFVFALLIGQIRDIVATASKSRSEFQRLLDETIHYMRRIHLPEDAQKRVFQWLTHTWDHQQVLDEQEVLAWLPSKLRGDVAQDVHEGSLSKVHLFRHCGQQLLRQLVLKLRPVLYLPGDYICRKGEVGKEMYIVKAGIIEVVGSKNREDSESEVLATLTEGSVFGEISLLDIGGGNKRTADVRSKGFSTLFVLSKADLKEALEHHPEAKQVLKEKASQLIRENADRERRLESGEHKEEDVAMVIKNDPNRAATPKLIDTVIQAVGTKSRAAQLLLYGSKAMKGDQSSDSNVPTTHNSAIVVGLKESSYMPCSGLSEVQENNSQSRNDSWLKHSIGGKKNIPSIVDQEHTGGCASLILNGTNECSIKEIRPQNVFEGDVTVHPR